MNTAYETIERKIHILRDAALRCFYRDNLDMALLWDKKAVELKWKLDHLTIGEAERIIL